MAEQRHPRGAHAPNSSRCHACPRNTRSLLQRSSPSACRRGARTSACRRWPYSSSRAFPAAAAATSPWSFAHWPRWRGRRRRQPALAQRARRCPSPCEAHWRGGHAVAATGGGVGEHGGVVGAGRPPPPPHPPPTPHCLCRPGKHIEVAAIPEVGHRLVSTSASLASRNPSAPKSTPAQAPSAPKSTPARAPLPRHQSNVHASSPIERPEEDRDLLPLPLCACPAPRVEVPTAAARAGRRCQPRRGPPLTRASPHAWPATMLRA
jgi:hypothetical protein